MALKFLTTTNIFPGRTFFLAVGGGGSTQKIQAWFGAAGKKSFLFVCSPVPLCTVRGPLPRRAAARLMCLLCGRGRDRYAPGPYGTPRGLSPCCRRAASADASAPRSPALPRAAAPLTRCRSRREAPVPCALPTADPQRVCVTVCGLRPRNPARRRRHHSAVVPCPSLCVIGAVTGSALLAPWLRASRLLTMRKLRCASVSCLCAL